MKPLLSKSGLLGMMNVMFKHTACFSGLLLLLLLPLSAYADLKAAAFGVKGKVSLERGAEILAVTENTPILPGDKILTEADGRVDIVANDLWSYRMLENSQTVLTDFNGAKAEVEFLQGNALFHVKPLDKDSRFEVKMPTAVVAVRGTQFWGMATPQNVTSDGTLAVKEGIVEIYLKNIDFTLTLAEGEAMDIPKSFQIPAVRAQTDAEKQAMRVIDEIPLLVLKADIGQQMSTLEALDQLAQEKKKSPLSSSPQ